MSYGKSRKVPKLLIVPAVLLIMAYAVSTSRNVAESATAPFSGAIFTSLGDGTAVNHNIYAAKCDVYLNGGPQNTSSAGLPPSEVFYFQVTDPSGATLLSTDDAVCRQVNTDANGVISGYHADAACTTAPHPNGSFNPANGSTPVQLCPFDFTPNPGGEYKVWLIRKTEAAVNTTNSRYIDFDPNDAKTDNFKVKVSECDPQDPTCGPRTTIGGVKYYDLPPNGVLDPVDALIPGWRVDVVNSAGPTVTTYTGPDGSWALLFPPGTTYTACEVLPGATSYTQTGPLVGAKTADNNATANSAKCWAGTVGLQDTADLNFGNVCIGGGGGLTLGFWSNKNGAAKLSANNNALLNSVLTLCLRKADGTKLGVVSLSVFQKFLTDANATNMANMLSAQLAAMWLNVQSNGVNGGSYIYAPGTNSANSLGYATVNAVMSEANTLLCSGGTNLLILSGNPDRARAEALKTALDKANNNSNFVQASPCSFTTPY